MSEGLKSTQKPDIEQQDVDEILSFLQDGQKQAEAMLEHIDILLEKLK